MATPPPSAVYLILGRRGSGKSTLTRRIIEHLPRPALVLDTMNEYERGLVFYSLRTLEAWIASDKPNNTGVYILKTTSDTDRDGFIEMVRYMQAPCTLVCDEASKLCVGGTINPALNDIIMYGRHWGISVVAAARRAVEIHTNIRSQADVDISFRQTEPLDIDRLDKKYGYGDYIRMLDFDNHHYAVYGDWQRTPLVEFFESDPHAHFPERKQQADETEIQPEAAPESDEDLYAELTSEDDDENIDGENVENDPEI